MEFISKKIDEKSVSLKRRGVISEQNRKYLGCRERNLGRFYMLPKIHERLVDVPGRPVISNCGTPTEKISKFVDFHLQPIVGMLPDIIRDTTDFLCRLRDLGDIPQGAIICSMDVVGLYPHIPHDEGLNSMKCIIEEFGKDLVIGSDDLIDLARFILENDFFEFEDKIYRQKLGTAIGTKFAPSFANLSMFDFEKKLLREYHLSPWVWWRFLDDIFIIWLHGD